MNKQIILRQNSYEGYWSFSDITLLDSGSLILTDYVTYKNNDGETVENNNTICLLPHHLEQLKALLKEGNKTNE